jgi:hypothetical protein
MSHLQINAQLQELCGIPPPQWRQDERVRPIKPFDVHSLPPPPGGCIAVLIN